MDDSAIHSLGELFFWNVEHFQHAPLLAWRNGERYLTYSTADFESAVIRLASWLTLSGLAPGDRVAIYSENRPEWHLVDFAAHLAGLVVVPVYPTLAPHQMEHVLQHSGTRAAFCGGEQMDRLQAVRASLPDLEHAVALDPSAGVEHLPAILAAAPPVTPAERASIRERVLVPAHADDLATIVYTSGTTGTPKGVMLTHRNIIFDMIQSVKRLPEERNATALSVLPLSHVFERILCYGYFLRGVPISYGDPHQLRELLNLHHPAIVGVVPRILEKVRDAIESTVAKMPPHRRQISKFLLGAGYAHLDGSRSFQSKFHPIARGLMFRKVRQQLGGVRYFICGGAWLNPELERYFRAMDFAVLQGYGLTETAPVITVNEFGAECIGTVGRPIDGIQLQVDNEGEILTRGPNVMQGYFRDPEATAKVFRDGWFVTGDLGRLDSHGHLVITGRRKEMLLLSNGKNIFYAPIEQALRHSRFIEQAFVIGEGRNYTTLVVVPNIPAVLRHGLERGILSSGPGEQGTGSTGNYDLLLTAPVLALFREEIDSLQAEFSRYEQAKRFCFLPEEALLDPDLVTPSQKVRRNVLEKKYAQFIDRLYNDEHPFVIPPGSVAPASHAPTSVS